MAQELFIAALAILTALCGCALLALLWRRRREGREEEQQHKADAARVAAIEPADGTTRAIDDYALPVSFEKARKLSEEDDDIGKICPACGSRYGSHFRYCERDNSELSALN